MALRRLQRDAGFVDVGVGVGVGVVGAGAGIKYQHVSTAQQHPRRIKEVA